VTARRTGYLVALIVAVLALFASIAFTLGTGFRSAHGDDTDGWRRMMVGGSMMDGSMLGGSMMGGRGAGMWSGTGAGGPSYGWNGTGPVTLEQARAQATTWVSKYSGGATLDAGVTMPMGYAFTAVSKGHAVAMIMVNDDTGAVWGRLWTTAGSGGQSSPSPSTNS
jgi:hypothetical protein